MVFYLFLFLLILNVIIVTDGVEEDVEGVGGCCYLVVMTWLCWGSVGVFFVFFVFCL